MQADMFIRADDEPEFRWSDNTDSISFVKPRGEKIVVYFMDGQPKRRDLLMALRDTIVAHLDAEANAMMEKRRGEMRA